MYIFTFILYNMINYSTTIIGVGAIHYHSGLMYGFVGEGTGSRHDTDGTGTMDVTGHDSNLAFTWLCEHGTSNH